MPLVRSFSARNEFGSLGRVIVTEIRLGMFGRMIFVDIFSLQGQTSGVGTVVDC